MSGSMLLKNNGAVYYKIGFAAYLAVYGVGVVYGAKACYAWGFRSADMRYEAKQLEAKQQPEKSGEVQDNN